MLQTLRIGQRVENLGVVAIVVDFHEITHDPILQEADRGTRRARRWLASTALCNPLPDAPGPVQHKNGLTHIG